MNLHTRLAMLLVLSGCSPSPLGLLTPPDAAAEADAAPPVPRDVRFAWSPSDASPSADARETPDTSQVADGGTASDSTATADTQDAGEATDARTLAHDVASDTTGDVASDSGVAPDAAAVADAHDAGLAPDVADAPSAPVCPGETSACGGACFDLRSDPQHCGACGTVCRTGDECRMGQCWGWVFRGAYPIDTRPYAREREMARLSAALDAECSMRVPGSRVCSREESEAAARAACEETDFVWITRDRVEWLVSNEAATSLWVCHSGAIITSDGALTGMRRIACCVLDQVVAANVVANVR